MPSSSLAIASTALWPSSRGGSVQARIDEREAGLHIRRRVWRPTLWLHRLLPSLRTRLGHCALSYLSRWSGILGDARAFAPHVSSAYLSYVENILVAQLIVRTAIGPKAIYRLATEAEYIPILRVSERVLAHAR